MTLKLALKESILPTESIEACAFYMLPAVNGNDVEL
jgi:hypothetical protein